MSRNIAFGPLWGTRMAAQPRERVLIRLVLLHRPSDSGLAESRRRTGSALALPSSR